MNANGGISAAHGIDFSVRLLLLENRPLAHADAQLHILGLSVILEQLVLEPALIHHGLKVDIHILALRLILRLLVDLLLLFLFHFLSSSLPLLFNFLNIIHDKVFGLLFGLL